VFRAPACSSWLSTGRRPLVLVCPTAVRRDDIVVDEIGLWKDELAGAVGTPDADDEEIDGIG
jgi:hypothetical protein